MRLATRRLDSAFSLSFNRLYPLFYICFCIYCKNANSDLIVRSFGDIVKESDVILFANTTRFKTTDSYGAGSAVLIPVSVLKGSMPSTFRITWSSEVHEQQINDTKLRLLFLRRKIDGGYTGTHYGRSYWVVEESFRADAACRLYTEYFYPITLINFYPYYAPRFFIVNSSNEGRTSTPILCLDSIQAILTSQENLE